MLPNHNFGALLLGMVVERSGKDEGIAPYEPSSCSHSDWIGVLCLLGDGLGFEKIWVLTVISNCCFSGGRFTGAWSAIRSATCKAAENDCLERRNSIRPCVPSHVAYKAERGGNELFWSPWTMYPRSQERHRNREATVYLPALGGDGPRLDRTIRIYKCSQASSAEESLKCCAALLAVSTEASGFSVMGNQHCRRIEQI
jgi:hypothetical protein